MTDREDIIASTEGVLDALRGITGRLEDALERYRDGGGALSLGEELEDLEAYLIPDAMNAMRDIARDIEIMGVDELKEFP